MFKIKDSYYIKIVPQRGDIVHRFMLTRKHIVVGSSILAGIMIVVLGVTGVQAYRSHAEVSRLQMQSAEQGTVLQQFDRQTTRLRVQLQNVQKENQEIQQLMGVHVPSTSAQARHALTGSSHAMRTTRPVNVATIQSRLLQLTRASAMTATQANRIHGLALRILNMRHIAQITRARMLAFIPSIDPVDGAQIVGCFCYRTYPDVEFHKGVDLGADYGEVVHASAAGTIASADWDGSYGEKIVIDHGNGYQTWYAHLSRMDVHAGQRVYKGEPIALVGATGYATGPHLHYQLMLNGQPIDPAPYLNGVPSNVVAALP